MDPLVFLIGVALGIGPPGTAPLNAPENSIAHEGLLIEEKGRSVHLDFRLVFVSRSSHPQNRQWPTGCALTLVSTPVRGVTL